MDQTESVDIIDILQYCNIELDELKIELLKLTKENIVSYCLSLIYVSNTTSVKEEKLDIIRERIFFKSL